MRVLFSKFNDAYSKMYQLGTSILEDCDGTRIVKKYPLTEEAAGHLYNMAQAYSEMNGRYGRYSLAPVSVKKDSLEFIVGENGTSMLLRALSEDGREGFLEMLKNLLDGMPEADSVFSASDAFEEFFDRLSAEETMPAYTRSILDFTANNIIFADGQWLFIDYEWFLPFSVPVDLLRFHFVECLYNSVPELSAKIRIEDVYAELGISNITGLRKCRDGFLKNVFLNENSLEFISGNYLKEALHISDMGVSEGKMSSLREKQELIEYQQARIQDYIKGFAEKDAWIVEQEKLLEYKDQVIADREEAIAAKDAWSAEQTKLLEYKDRVIADREEAIAAKDAWSAEQTKLLEYKDRVIADREEAIAAKDAWSAEQTKLLEYKDQVIADREEAIAAKDAWSAEQTKLLEYKDRVIADREEAIAVKDAWSAEQTKLLEYKDQVVAERDNALAAKDAWIREQAIALAKKEEEIEQMKEKMEVEHKKRLVIQNRLYEIENSKFWRSTAIFHKNLDNNNG